MNEHVALKVPLPDYDRDFYDWSIRQAELLRAGRFADLDIDNVAEEIESLGRSDRSALRSQMVRLIEHLLKLHFAEDTDPRNGWRRSVIGARRAIAVIVDDSPSLRRQRDEFFESCRIAAVELAVAGLGDYNDPGVATIGATAHAGAPFTLEQALDPVYFPDAPAP